MESRWKLCSLKLSLELKDGVIDKRSGMVSIHVVQSNQATAADDLIELITLKIDYRLQSSTIILLWLACGDLKNLEVCIKIIWRHFVVVASQQSILAAD